MYIQTRKCVLYISKNIQLNVSCLKRCDWLLKSAVRLTPLKERDNPEQKKSTSIGNANKI